MPIYEIIGVEDLNFEPNDIAFCDTETYGLYGKVVLFQCYVASWDKVKIIHTPDVTTLNKKLNEVRTVWYNASYDLSVLDCIFDKFDDAMLLSMLAFPEMFKYSLDSVLEHVLGEDPYIALNINKKALQKSDWTNVTDEQYLYASLDVYHMPKLYDTVKEHKNSNSYKVDKKCLIASLKFQKNGMPLDTRKLKVAKKKLEEKLEEDKLDFNVNSWQQTREALHTDESDRLSLMKKSLEGDQLATAILKNRRNSKMLSFIDKYNDIKDSDNRVYGHFSPSARSGRFRCSNENLQQIPRALKNLFGFEDSSKVLIISDYAQLELRTIASILNISKMVQMFKNDEDLHMFTAQKMFGEDATKEQRHIAKTFNFNLLYGGSANMVRSILISQGILISVAQARKYKSKWLLLYPEIAKWQAEQIFKWQQGTTGFTKLGRPYKAKLMTDQMNIMNQGTGAEVAKLALIEIQEQLNKPENKDIKLLNFIHDSYILEAPADENAERAVDILGKSMAKGWSTMLRFFKVKDMPMPIEVFVGSNWGDIEKGEYLSVKEFC